MSVAALNKYKRLAKLAEKWSQGGELSRADRAALATYLERVPDGDEVDADFWLGEIWGDIRHDAARDLERHELSEYDQWMEGLRREWDRHGRRDARRLNPPRPVRVQEVISSTRRPLVAMRKIASPDDLVDGLRDFIADRSNEVFVAVFVDVRNNVLGYVDFHSGAPASVEIHPSGVFKEALLVNASGYVTAHQHPTGDPTPSAEDFALWARLRQAGEIVGIACLDNLVITPTAYFSEMANEVRRVRPATNQ